MTPEGKIVRWFRYNMSKYYPEILCLRYPGGRFATPGVPDFLCINNGKVVGVELKSESGALTKHQIEFQDMLRNKYNTPAITVYGKEKHKLEDIRRILN